MNSVRVTVECSGFPGRGDLTLEGDAEVEIDTDGSPYVRWIEARDAYGRKLPPETIERGWFDDFKGDAIEAAKEAGLVVPEEAP